MSEKLPDKNWGGSAILFDLDGTLVDTADDLAASMNYALGFSGIDPVPSKEVRHLVGFGARRMLAQAYLIALGRDAREVELDGALERFLAHYEDNIAVHSRPFDGVVEMIERLRRKGVHMAICTNKREAMARLLIDRLGLQEMFETIVGADTAEAAKPDPAPVRLCMERLGASRGIFIGDSDTDIRAAASVGMPCFVASFGYGPLELAKQAILFDRYGDVVDQIEQALVI